MLLVAERAYLQLQIESFQANECEVSHALRAVRESFTEAKHEAQMQVAVHMALCFEFLEHQWPSRASAITCSSCSGVIDQSTLYSPT